LAFGDAAINLGGRQVEAVVGFGLSVAIDTANRVVTLHVPDTVIHDHPMSGRKAVPSTFLPVKRAALAGFYRNAQSAVP
jgi:hypothetical protein